MTAKKHSHVDCCDHAHKHSDHEHEHRHDQCQQEHVHNGHDHGHNHEHHLHDHCGHDHHGHHHDHEAVEELAASVSLQFEGKVPKSVFRIDGMDCADCARKLEKKVGALPAIRQVNVNFGAAKMTVYHDGSSVEQIIRTVGQAGYEASEEKGIVRREPQKSFWRSNKKVYSTGLAGVFFGIAWILEQLDTLPVWSVNLLYAVAIIAGGYRIARSGLYGLKSRTIGMDLLMVIAAIGAAVIGEWEEGAAVVFLFSLGETLEAYTMDRTRNSIRGLMELAPNEALVRRGQREELLPVDQIALDDIVLVKPGEKIAMDGIIVNGRSSINQAPITGESVPVEKGAGEEVYAGTVNQEGLLEIRVTKLFKDNTLSRIIHMVEEAQAQKAPSQRFVDVFSKYYTPIVIIAAILIALIPPLGWGQSFETWIYRALMMLVVSCPCALVISTPVSIVSAIGNAARNGILIKGGAHLERLGAITAFAFDKTGTLTAGIPEVTGIKVLSDWSRTEVLSIAATLETYSDHPIAKAIVRRAIAEGIIAKPSTNFISVVSKGVQAEVGGTTYYIGKPRWFESDFGISLNTMQQEIQSQEQQGQTVMLLGTRDTVIAMISVADTIRENSKETLTQLKKIGIRKTIMLTGDNQGTARAVADQLGGVEYRAELLPQDKVSAVQQIIQQENGVAMVGDGVNDAPALAAATVGIAMGAAGTDTALETADVALMADDLSKLPYAVGLSRRALRIIKQNIAFSLLVKAVFILLIFAGKSTLWMSVLADTGSSLLVIANGMRLLRQQQPLRVE